MLIYKYNNKGGINENNFINISYNKFYINNKI